MPRIDIAIVNYRGVHDTLQALARLHGWIHGKVFVVDNSAHDPDMEAQTNALQMACASNNVTLLQPGENLGFGRACNLAFAQSQTEYFLLLNPDARIAPQDITTMANAMAAQPQCAAASPAIYWNTERTFVLPAADPQNPQHSLGLALRTRSRTLACFLADRAINRSQRQMGSKLDFVVPCLAGAVMLLRRSAVMEAGGLFDPQYFMFYEDADLSLRLRRLGYRLLMLPQCAAVHEYRHQAFKAPLMERSQQQYFRKNFPRFHSLTGSLRHVGRLARPQYPDTWFEVLRAPIDSATEFRQLTEEAGVIAFSPSSLMAPAIARPLGAKVTSFTDVEWGLLEPASYTALIQARTAQGETRWIRFTKA